MDKKPNHIKLNRKILLSKKTILLSFAIIILLWSILQPPRRYGDGLEYLAMTVSFSNHFTPELREIDRNDAQNIAINNNDKLNPEFPGYFKDLDGRFYSFHFWAYSLLCVPIYWILKLLNANLLSVFQIVNAFLMITALYWTLYVSRVNDKLKLWFVIGLICNPILLYIQYTHPEVFSFVFLFIALLALADNKRALACVLTAIASWQNPAIAVVTAYIGIIQIVNNTKMKKIDKAFFYVGFSCCLVVIPYIWYFWHYNKFSLIGSNSTTGISIEKALNLLFDLNMGLFLYVPILFFVLVWQILKRDINAITYSILVIIISLICSTQLNWNSGMSYINRYAVWIIPLVVFGCYNIFLQVGKKNIIVLMVLFIFSTGSIITYCIVNYEQFNFVTFSRFAKIVMSKAPVLYNPPAEVFIERAKNIEITPTEAKNYLPLAMSNELGVRKILIFDDGEIKYKNAPTQLRGLNNVITTSKPQNSIFDIDALQYFDSGWKDLEKSNEYFRWSTKRSNLYFSTGRTERKNITMEIASFQKNTVCEIYFNDKILFKDIIPVDYKKISFMADVDLFNKITIISPEYNEIDDPDALIRFNVKNIMLK